VIKILFCHLGPKRMPLYVFQAIAQARAFAPSSPVAVLAPAIDLHSFQDHFDDDVEMYPIEEYYAGQRNQAFRAVNFLDYDPAHWQGFWSVTLQRFMIIEEWMRCEKRSEVLHIENDILIYTDPNKYSQQFKALATGKIAVTDGADWHSSGAYCYIDNADGVGIMNQHFIDFLSKGEKWCRDQQGPECIVSEMTMLSAIRKAHPSDMAVLPILPSGKGSDNFEQFNSLFDSMSWGQYVGGVHQNPGVPWAYKGHWVGERVLAGELDVAWGRNSFGQRVPYVYDTHGEKSWPLNNLHIHSKQLDKWR